jgi:hypothetical protein
MLFRCMEANFEDELDVRICNRILIIDGRFSRISGLAETREVALAIIDGYHICGLD